LPDVVSELPGWLSAGVDFGHIAAELGPILGESHSRDRILAGLPSEDFERTLAGQRNAGGLYLDYVLANAGMDRPRLSAIGPDDLESLEHGVAADVEVISIDKVNEAYERMLKGDVRYRFVIDIASLK